MDLRKEIADKVRIMRISNQISQKDLADKLSCSPALINQIEKGQKPLTLDMAFRIEITLGHTAKELSSAIIQAIFEEAGGKETPIKPLSPEQVHHKIESLNKIAEEHPRIQGEIISVPVKLPRDIYLKLQFE